MTLKKSEYRKRRTANVNGLPKHIREWFAGERKFTFYAYTYPYKMHLGEYWEAWISEHPQAIKPEGLDNLINISIRRGLFIEGGEK